MKSFLIITCLFFIYTSNTVAQSNLRVELKTAKPDIYIDGKKYDYEILELLDQSKIESINVIKDEQAAKKYNAPNGVIIIKSKKAAQQANPLESQEEKAIKKEVDPMVYINGKKSDKDTLSKLDPKDIESINVFKGEKAIKKYNAPNGVILVKTKK